MGAKGNQTTQATNSTQQYKADPQIQHAAYGALGGAEQASQAPFQMPVAPTAPFSPLQNQFFNQVQGAQGMSLPYFDDAAQYMRGSASPISEQDVQQYYNPMAQNVFANLQDVFGQQMHQATGNAVQQAGGTGADRIGVTQANLAKQQGLAAGQTAASLYQPALAAAQQQKQMMAGAGFGLGQLGPAAQTSFLQGTSALGQAGQQQQSLQQQMLNAYYQNQLARIAYPFQTPQYLAGITGGLAPALGGTSTGQSNSTTTYPTPSPLNQALGIGAAGLGAYMSGGTSLAGKGAMGGLSNFGGTGGKGSSPTVLGGSFAAGGAADKPPALPGTEAPPVDASTIVPGIPLQPGGGHSDLGFGHPNLFAKKDDGGGVFPPPDSADAINVPPDMMSALGGAVGPFDHFRPMQGGGDSGESWEPDLLQGIDAPMGDTSKQPRFTMGDLARKAGDYWPKKTIEAVDSLNKPPEKTFGDAVSGAFSGSEAQAAPAGNPFASAPTQGARPDIQTNMGPSNPLSQSEGLPLPRGNPNMPLGARATMAAEASRAGAPENAIRGLNMAVNDESKFNPFSRESDQPNFGGEAHYAHGLFQEGGDEWNNYKAWLDKNHPDADWQDPALQTRFLTENLKQNYPKVWEGMSNAKTPGEAAAIFTEGYLKPAQEHKDARVAKYLSGRGDEGDSLAGGTNTLSGRSRTPENPFGIRPNADILGNRDMTLDSIMRNPNRPYPDALKRDWGQNAVRSPWMALVEGGAKMAQHVGPVGSAIGAGIEAGSKTLKGQRQELQSEEDKNQKADALFQHAKTHLDQYQRITPYEKATMDWRQTKLDTPTGAAGWKYKAWLSANPGDQKGALEFAGGRRQVPEPQLRHWAMDQAMKEKKDDPSVDIDKRRDELLRYYKEDSGAPIGQRKAFKDKDGKDVFGIWDGFEWKPETT